MTKHQEQTVFLIWGIEEANVSLGLY